MSKNIKILTSPAHSLSLRSLNIAMQEVPKKTLQAAGSSTPHETKYNFEKTKLMTIQPKQTRTRVHELKIQYKHMFCMYYVPWWPALPRQPSVLRSPWHPRPSVRRCCSTSWRCWFATHNEQELPFSREASERRQQKDYVKENTSKAKEKRSGPVTKVRRSRWK